MAAPGGSLNGGRELASVEQSQPLLGRLIRRIIDFANSLAVNAANGITALTGDVTATGPGSVKATVTGINGASVPLSVTAIGTNSSGQIVPASAGGGTVTSVGLTTPSWLTVFGSPVTSAGMLAVTGTSEPANQVLASPDGTAGAMTPRALVADDLPDTAVTPGSYTNTDLTVDATGRITAASNGSGGDSSISFRWTNIFAGG